jgi:hypothetical protein
LTFLPAVYALRASQSHNTSIMDHFLAATFMMGWSRLAIKTADKSRQKFNMTHAKKQAPNASRSSGDAKTERVHKV